MTRSLQVLLGGPATRRTIEALMEASAKEKGRPLAENQREALRDVLVNAALGRVYLCTYNEEPCGFVLALFVQSVRHGGRIAVIDEVYVAPRRQDQGISKSLIRYAVADLDTFGVVALAALEEPSRPLSALLEAEGFERCPCQLFEKRFDPAGAE